MNKNHFKECIIEYVNRVQMVDREFEPGKYHFECKIIIGENGSVDIINHVLQSDQLAFLRQPKK